MAKGRGLSGRGFLEQHILVEKITGEQRQAGATNSACLTSDRTLPDIGYADTLKIVQHQGVARCFDDARAHPAWEAAIDDHGGEINDRRSGNDGLGKCGTGIADSYFQRFAEIDPFIGRKPQRLGVYASFT